MPKRPAETSISQEEATTTTTTKTTTTKNTMTAPKPMTTKPKPLPQIKDYGPNAIEINDLTFAYNTNAGSAMSDDNVKNILQGLNLTLETGSRCLLIGANGRYVCILCDAVYERLASFAQRH